MCQAFGGLVKLTFITEPIGFFNLQVLDSRIQNGKTAWYGNFNQIWHAFLDDYGMGSSLF